MDNMDIADVIDARLFNRLWYIDIPNSYLKSRYAENLGDNHLGSIYKFARKANFTIEFYRYKDLGELEMVFTKDVKTLSAAKSVLHHWNTSKIRED